ncbi:uncharacterized protein [Manis javanica]|uniref:uncharacterized protein isoform X4 n=1 Tax=Manis javanica TaxID=9974 RepID=UPI003C6CEF6A
MRKPGLLIPGPRAACSSPGHIWASEQRNQSSWRPSTAAGPAAVRPQQPNTPSQVCSPGNRLLAEEIGRSPRIPPTAQKPALRHLCELSGEQERMRRRRVWIPGLRPFGEWPALPEGSNQNEEVSIVTTLQLIRGRRLTVPLF